MKKTHTHNLLLSANSHNVLSPTSVGVGRNADRGSSAKHCHVVAQTKSRSPLKAGMTVLALFFISNTAHAASCYTPAQFRAEQVVRLQTQLMMTSLLCPSAVPGVPSAYSAYMQFNTRHKNFMSVQENTLLAFYKSQGLPLPDRQLHTFKTNMANRLATFAANRAPGVFCKNYGARLQQAVRLTPVALQNWGNQIALNRPSTYPVCK